MRRATGILFALAVSLGAFGVHAQSPTTATPSGSSASPAVPSAPAASSTAATTASAALPSSRTVVLEDDYTRIEELHVRGQAQRVVVKSKQTTLPAWEIRPDTPARMGAHDSRLRETGVKRAWTILVF
jgi:hypothetical protein